MLVHVSVYLYHKRVREFAVTFLKLFEDRQRRFDDLTLDLPLTQIRYSEDFIVSCIDAFISMVVSCHKFTVMSLYNISHLFEHCTIDVFQKLSRFDVFSVNHRTDHIRFSNTILISRQTSFFTSLLLVLSPPKCIKRLCNQVFAPSSRMILVTKDCLFSIDSRGRLARLRPSSRSMHSSHRCSETFSQNSDIVGIVACYNRSHSFSTTSISFSLYHST